ncbi:MAG: DNA polymerase IV [Treponema sp.]|nr:DNA polymerase IV [Treponema sp.]
MKYQKCFLHVDLDAFFASVEQLDHPDWKGKPVIVGGLPGEARSVVSTASYEARKFGVHSAMPVYQAYKLCPQGIFTHGRHNRYAEISEKVMDTLKKYSPDINQLSIDEASLDITGTELLFGQPEEIAKKIKDEVLLNTGLTVSIGLASNAYLAKIASEINKPNGFYQINPGDEEKFMLELPLKKVWGIGKKTLEKLNHCGFYTTSDIFKQSKELLQKLFGESSGTFLYNSVRGIPTEAKTEGSHSISAESTFIEDISDLYIAETKLMELCHSVLFRMKKEECLSRTVMIKLRYDDFSTISIRGTEEEYIKNLDQFFDRAKKLFEKKYEQGRPIRLLGVGLENLLSEKDAEQEVLFDFGEKKKEAIEKAILKLKDKHPEVQVKKARLLQGKKLSVIIALLLSFLPLQSKLQAEEITVTEADRAAALENTNEILPQQVESARTLFDKKIGKAALEFLAQGYWEGNVTGNLNFQKDSDGWDFEAETPVFKQQVDLSVYFMLNKQWYFEADFADEFNKNTLAAGFYGKDSNPLKHARIANRGIVFPAGYSLDLFSRSIGGGDNQAPGIILHFEDPSSLEKIWKADFAFRYDMTDSHYALYYGKNSVSTSSISPASYIRGQFFILPEKSGLIDKIKAIYVENSSGSYKDSYGRKFKKVQEDLYIIKKSRSSLYLSKDAGTTRKNSKTPTVILEFTEEINEEIFGSYSDKNSFLGQIQEYFGNKVNLQDFSYKLITKINGKNALIIQNSNGFSPFINASRYDLGIVKQASVMIASSTSSEKVENYNITISEDLDSFLDSSFYSENHTYAEVYTKNNNNSGQPSPEERYPLASELPGFYLDYTENTDIAILLQNYTPVKNYDIGLNIPASSVKVYKNNILDTGAKYDEETGTVSLSSSVSDSDKIYISWKEDSANNEEGAISAQAALSIRPVNNLTWDIAASTNWTVNPYRDYAEYGRPSEGYVSAASGLAYKKEGIELSNAIAATFENKNVTGLYRIDGMENAKSKSYYLSENSGFVMKNGIIPQIEGLDLKAENDYCQNSESTKGITDSLITGYKIPLEWAFPEKDGNNLYWAAENIKLSAGYLLSSGTEFRLALKNETYTETNFDLYLQLGTEASDDPQAEYTDKIPCWKLTGNTENSVKSAFSQSTSGWQIIRIALTDAQRSCFQSFSDARLIVTGNSKSEGIITVGPYEIVTQGIFTRSDDKLNLTSEQIKDNFIPDRKTFNEDSDNYVQKIEWNSDSNVTESEESFVTAAKYFSETDLSDYKNVEFFYKLESQTKESFSGEIDESQPFFKIQLDRESTSIDSDGKIALLVLLRGEAYKIIQANKNFWHKLSLNIEEKSVQIDGTEIPEEYIFFFYNKDVIPTRLKVNFSTLDIAKKSLTKGAFYIDELSLSESSPGFLFQDIADFKLEKKGQILTNNSFVILEDALFKTRNTSSFSIKANDSSDREFLQQNTANASITIAGIEVKSDLSLSSSEYNLLSSMSQKVETKRPILDVINFKDHYIYNHADKSIDKNSEINMDFSSLNIPILLNGKVISSSNLWNFSNKMQDSIEIKLERLLNLNIKGEVNTEESRSPSSQEVSDLEDESYFSGYSYSSKECFTSGSESASKRLINLSTSLSFDLPFINLRPQFTLSTKEKYANASSAKYTDTFILDADFPFSINNQNFRFNYTREAGGTILTESGGSYGSDFAMLKDNLSDHDFFFKALPIRDLISSHERLYMSDISQEDSNTENLKYSAKYYFSWKRPVFQDLKDLFIPSNFNFSASRTLVTSSDSSDTYFYHTNILNTPLNLFGSLGKYRLFTFYKSDEYIFSLTGSAKIPVNSPSDSLFSLSTYISSSFFITDKNLLKAASEVKLQTDESWSVESTLTYKRESSFSPIISLCRVFYEKYDWSKAIITRTNSLDIKLSNSEDILIQEYEAGHKLSLEFSRLITINTGASVKASYNNSTEIFSLILSGTIGGKVSF